MNKKEALTQHITYAILRGDSYYEGHSLPSPQRSGTSTQQRSYAEQEAESIVERIK